MNKQQKSVLVDQVKHDMAGSTASFVVGIQGISVAKLQELRKALRQEKSVLRVVKNTLMRKVLREVSTVEDESQTLAPYCRQQVAIVFTHRDPSFTAKLLCNFSKENERLAVIAGSFERHIMNRQMVQALGALPPREVLIAQALGALQGPIAQHIFVLNQTIGSFLSVLQQIK